MTPRRRKQHEPERIVAKLRDAPASERRRDLAAELQPLEIGEVTLAGKRSGVRKAAKHPVRSHAVREVAEVHVGDGKVVLHAP